LGVVLAAAGCLYSPDERAARAARDHVNRGDIALALQRYDEAEQAYRSALAALPDEESALVGLARAEVAQGEYVAAVERYDELALYRPESFRALHDDELCPTLIAASQHLLAEGDSRAALVYARRAERDECTTPGTAAALSRALVAEATRTSPPDAADLYREAASTDPALAVAFLEGATLLLEQGRREEALELLSEGMKHHPNDRRLQSLAVDALGIRLIEQGLSPDPQ
jgi:tetratricopeptide (TPR) repeat protein